MYKLKKYVNTFHITYTKGGIFLKHINSRRLFAVTLLLTIVLALSISYAKSVGSDISNSVLRLHIIANSNSPEDQQLKLKVRDRIIEESSYLFENVSSRQEAMDTAILNTEKILSIARDEIKSQGFDHEVSAEIGQFPFPTRMYGEITLPSGRYTALRLKIGNAKGENWWCVMYPPLCFADGVVSVNEGAKNQLKDNLTSEEYNLITSTTSGAIPVEIRFKIVEIFQRLF